MHRRDSLKVLLGASAGSLFSEAWAAGARQGQAAGGNVTAASAIAPAFTWLMSGEVKPAGWIKEQMVRDLNQGFTGRLDELCAEASSDIFVSHRNSGRSENTVNSAKVNWWNGETEGNWRAGFMQMAYLAEDRRGMERADEYVRHILSSQDPDGYLGVFAPDIRFSRPGELWTETCLMRGLLAYSELKGDARARQAVVRAADLVLAAYGPGKQLVPPQEEAHGLPHDLMISDVMEKLFDSTGDVKYRDFTAAIYGQLSESEKDADTSLAALLNRNAEYFGHGANTFETMRVPLWLWMATGRADLGRAWRNAFDKLTRYTEPGGSAVSQEFIERLRPDPSATEYEYCATKEIQFTLESALQKTGEAGLGDRVEWLWFNAAQGSRLPDGSAVSYLTHENRLRCDGTSPDGLRPDADNKFSPTHADIAVCCNPNAANVAPLYVRGMWMRPAGGGLAAVLYGPCRVATTIDGARVGIEERTNYPFENSVEIEIRPEREAEFPILLRDPGWSMGTTVRSAGARIGREGSYWIVTKKWKAGDTVSLSFSPSVREVAAVNGEVGLQYGALLFAQPIAAQKRTVKAYPVAGFEDSYYVQEPGRYEALALAASLRWRGLGMKPVPGKTGANPLRPFDEPVVLLAGSMLRQADGAAVEVALAPLGNVPTLRRVTFPVMP